MTVTRFENGRSQGAPDKLAALQRALEKAGVKITPENGDEPRVKLRKDRRK